MILFFLLNENRDEIKVIVGKEKNNYKKLIF